MARAEAQRHRAEQKRLAEQHERDMAMRRRLVGELYSDVEDLLDEQLDDSINEELILEGLRERWRL
jgi:hypothetical protein